jgi:glycosyltransferase involved in cell wall biosynthesis
MHLLSHQLIRAIKDRTEVPVMFSPHYDVATSSKISSSLLPIFNKIIGGKTANLCDHLFFGSEFESMAYINSMGGAKYIFSVIPHGVDFEISESISRWDEVLELVYCGHMIRRKRVDRIIKLTKEIIRQSPEISLRVTVVGEGPELGSLMKLATDLNIDEHLSWRGFLERDEMLKTIKNADFFVLLSDSEAFGITVAESLASGTPVVISDNTALSEFSPEPGTILAKDPDDFQQIAREIISLRRKEIKIGPFSDRIREWDETAIEYLDKYTEQLDRDKLLLSSKWFLRENRSK